MYETTTTRAGKAARRYLELKGIEVLEEFERDGIPYIAADDDGTLVIARVSYSTDGIPEPWSDRGQFEEVASAFLRTFDRIDLTLRGDSLDLMVLSQDRAMLRHTVNCTGGAHEA